MGRREKLTTKHVFKPIVARRTTDFVVDAIAKAIFFCEVQVGEKLPSEQTLASQLGTNRSALREALKRMEEDGILETRAGAAGGTFVISRPPASYIQMFLPAVAEVEDFVEILIVRRALEPSIIELAASRATHQDLTELRSILEPLSALRSKTDLTDEDIEILSMAALQFNIILGRATQIKFLETLMQVLAQKIEPVRRYAIKAQPLQSIDTLNMTLDALERNDIDTIRATLERRFDYLEQAWEQSTGRRLWREKPRFLPLHVGL